MKNIVPYLVALIIVACSAPEPPKSDINSNVMAVDSIQSNQNVSSNKNNTEMNSALDNNGNNNDDKGDDFRSHWGQMGDSEKQYFINQLNKNMGTSFDFKKINENPNELFSVISGLQSVMDIGALRDMVPKSDTKDTFELIQEQSSGYNVPALEFFATNKSDRFLVDFEDIIAGHPLVGANSPRPHNDAQVYFSNTDSRWVNATQPEDYPPIYAVADGYVNLPKLSFYNVLDHSNSDPPWGHVAYVFTLRIATDDGSNVEFLYQMEPYMIPDLVGKPKDFYRQFIKVENGQFVKKGDILGYMYVPALEEMVGNLSLIHI